MNNFLELLMTVLTFIAVIYSSFAAFKVDYYNPIVKIFVSLIMPFSKLLFFLNPFLVGLIAGMIFSFFGLYINAGSAYEISYIIGLSFFNKTFLAVLLSLATDCISSFLSFCKSDNLS